MASSTRSLALVSLAGFLYGVCNATVWFLMPTFAKIHITDNLVFVSLLMAFSALMPLVFDLPIGTLSDYVGRKKVIMFGLILLIPVGASLLVVSSMEQLIAFLAAFGILNTFVLGTARALIMDICPPKKAAEYFGIILGLITLGGAVGVLAGGMILGETFETFSENLPLVIGLYTLVAVLSMLAFAMVTEPIKKRLPFIAGIKKVAKGGFFMPAVMEFGALKKMGIMVLYVTFILTIIDACVWSFEPLFYDESGFGPAFGGQLLFILTFSLVIFQPVGGWLATKFGEMTILKLGLLFGGVFFIIMSTQTDELILASTAFLASLGLAFAWPAVSGVITEISLDRQKGSIAGVWTFFMDLAYVIGPLAGGVVMAASGTVASIFTFMGVLLALSSIPLVVMKKK